MRNLVIYDQTGKILVITNGDVSEPVGVPFLWVDILPTKHLTHIDVTGVHTPVFADYPKSEEQQRLEAAEEAINFLLGL